jgi:hypothetical protein
MRSARFQELVLWDHFDQRRSREAGGRIDSRLHGIVLSTLGFMASCYRGRLQAHRIASGNSRQYSGILWVCVERGLGPRLSGGGTGIRTLSRTFPGLLSRYSAMPQADTLFFPVRWNRLETAPEIQR